MKQIITLITIGLGALSLQAQNCGNASAYFPFNKGLVKDYAEHQIEMLNTEALKILNIKEAELCENFGVFDVAHYSIKEYTKDGYTEDIEAYKKYCSSKKPYYLLFIRKFDSNLDLKNIEVELSLPTDKRFSCLTPMQRNLIKVRLELKIKERIQLESSGLLAESGAIMVLSEQINKVINCCDGGRSECMPDCPNKIEIAKILKNNQSFIINPYIEKCELEIIEEKNAFQFSKIIIKNPDGDVDLFQDIKEFLAKKEKSGHTVEVFLTSHLNTCIIPGLASKGIKNESDFLWVAE